VPVETALLQIAEEIVSPVFVDQLDLKLLKARTFALHLRKTLPARVILDNLCAQTGLDYALIHNHLVIGHPDRLWPSGPPTKAHALNAEEMTRVKELVERLNDDSIEAREAASRDLLKVGPSAIPLLEENLRRKEPEIVARCLALIEKLRPSGRGVFGPAGAARQKKDPENEPILGQLQTLRVSLDFQDTSLKTMAEYLKEFTGIGFEVQGVTGGKVITLKAKDQVLLDILSLMTQSREMDFMIQEGKVLIDTREAIEKLLAGKK
ncbi:MAG TPA: hypothetical protein VK661_04730, partial [Planctomycetota bacterium]|nr:hypothetical protein [Planctomycetota bacterium]